MWPNRLNLNIKIAFTIVSLFTFIVLIPLQGAKRYNLPEAYFRKDSVKIGEQVKLALIYKHNPAAEFLFPDSAYNFFPFEFVKKDFYPTHTDSVESTDSIVYTLTTFELESNFRLSLPVYLYEGGDTLPLYSNDAEILLSEVITQTSGTDSLRVNTQYKVLSGKLNYPYLLIGLGILLLIIAIVLVFFRKKILNRYRLYLIGRDYKSFIRNFEKIEIAYISQTTTSELELTLSTWKKYLEKLEKLPYTTLTSKEISKLFDYNQLTSSLQNFDRAIYGGYVNENLTNSIVNLRETATLRYQQKQKELENA